MPTMCNACGAIYELWSEAIECHPDVVDVSEEQYAEYKAAQQGRAGGFARKEVMNLDNLFVIELVFVKENGNSIKYGFTTAEQVIGFLQGEIAAQQSVHPTVATVAPPEVESTTRNSG